MVLPNARNAVSHAVRSHFPAPILRNLVRCVIGYGSGIFPQSAHPANNTVDLLIVVDSSPAFHSQMLVSQPSDYAGLARLLGSGYLSMLGRQVFPMHFNHVKVGQQQIKYGVVDSATWMTDLVEWNLLSLAGRMHKPVCFNILDESLDPSLQESVASNHRKALAVAILGNMSRLNRQIVPLSQLYELISEISYMGDIRNTLSVENKSKVQNIVRHNLQEFNSIYLPILTRLAANTQQSTLEFLNRTHLKIHYTSQLVTQLCDPHYMPSCLYDRLSVQSPHQGTLAQKALMTGIGQISTQIRETLAATNRRSSARMAAQNLLAGSLANNARYLWRKIGKRNSK